MTMKRLVLATLALSLLSGAAYAAPDDRDRDHDRDRDRDRPAYGLHREEEREAAKHRWVRGEHFVRGPGFVVLNDWNHFRLRPPPFGFYWAREGGDFLLINYRTGLVADVIEGN